MAYISPVPGLVMITNPEVALFSFTTRSISEKAIYWSLLSMVSQMVDPSLASSGGSPLA